jgi:hypothetical protein
MEKSNFQFALPTIGTSEMSRNDQGALIVNQATAAIDSTYLEHAATIHTNNGNTTFSYTQAELISLINEIQGALKSF